jgi:tetratricopeptide (TPR) repeat protein
MSYHSKQSVVNILRISGIAVLCLVISKNLYADINADEQFQLGKNYYSAGDYEAAIDAVTAATVTAPDISSYHHWLGRSYGQLARNAGLFRAYSLSRKTRQELELAVELDNENAEALADLMKFYEQAPSFLGGGKDKAEEIRKRLAELEIQSVNSE